MGLRLVNTAPGIVTDPIKPGQFLHLGLKSETQNVQLAATTVDVGYTSMANTGAFPEDDPSLTNLGVTHVFETSERRRPSTGAVSRSLLGNSLVFTKTSNNNGDFGIYEAQIPIHPGDSILAYFKFRKKTAWTPYNPDWCNLTNVVGMYFGVEHGTFNTAAYAFLRNNGSGGSIVFAGPLQAYNTARGGQVELAQDLDPVAGGTQGWMGLADNAVIEIFIRINTYITPFRAELWTRIASTPAPVYQGSIPLGALGLFPNTVFTNSRVGTSETATIFFGNIGRTGDILQLDDWALFPNYGTVVKDGVSTPFSEVEVLPDVPIRYKASTAIKPTDVRAGRWFPTTSGTTPVPSFFYQPGSFLNPLYLTLPKTGPGYMTFERTEPRLESLADGFMIESFISGSSETRIGDLVGPGFSVEDGANAYRLTMLQTTTARTFGILSSLVDVTDIANYYIVPGNIDFRSLKLLRMTVDRRRSRVTLHIDDEKVLDLPINSQPQINSGVQIVPTTTLSGTTLTVDVSVDGGTIWVPHSHTFPLNLLTVADIVNALNADGVFIGAGPQQIEVLNRGDTFGIRTVQAGPLMGIRINGGSSAIGTGKLNLTSPSTTFGIASTFPPAPGPTGKVFFGHPIAASYDATLKMSSIGYLNRYLAWEGEDSLFPDSLGIESTRRFTLDSSGPGFTDMVAGEVVITKADFGSSSTKRFYKRNQSLTDVGGIQVDFSTYVPAYTDEFGQVGASNTAVGAGLTVFLGNKRVFLGFYDCGLSGRVIGIIPGTGTDLDIVNQTLLGVKFSAAVDWSRFNKYRLVIQAFKKIEVWAGTTVNEPIISIPWRNSVDGFDLPLDITSPGVAFGHFNFLTTPSSSISKWGYVRWGHSNGYELAVSQKYPNGRPKYLFGGRAFIQSDFDEAP